MSKPLDTYGNQTTMNMNEILYQNIMASPYFKGLYEKKTFHEIVDEIYNQAPFIKDTTPSTAFCCLFKLWTLRLTEKQVENLIDHTDSPYIRAIGFLYLRYVCQPKQLWDWLGYYIEDEEQVAVSVGPKSQPITIGKLCRMLLTEQKYMGTMLPRIPVLIARDLTKKLEEHDSTHKQETETPKGSSAGRNHQERSHSPRDRRHHSRDRDTYRQSGSRREYSYSRSRSISPNRSRSRSRDYRHSRYNDDRRRDRYRDNSRDRYSSRDRSDRDDRYGRRSRYD